MEDDPVSRCESRHPLSLGANGHERLRVRVRALGTTRGCKLRNAWRIDLLRLCDIRPRSRPWRHTNRGTATSPVGRVRRDRPVGRLRLRPRPGAREAGGEIDPPKWVPRGVWWAGGWGRGKTRGLWGGRGG